jgi:hypothetical protein
MDKSANESPNCPENTSSKSRGIERKKRGQNIYKVNTPPKNGKPTCEKKP